jgi:hypothetical protein
MQEAALVLSLKKLLGLRIATLGLEYAQSPHQACWLEYGLCGVRGLKLL